MGAVLSQIDTDQDDGVAVVAFDYSGLAAAHVVIIRGAEDAIRQHARRHIDEAIAIGRELIRVKNILEHGQFGKWIAACFAFSERTATNYMRAAEVYGDKSEMVADLQLPPATLYRAASSSIPDEDRSRLFAPADDGSRPTETLVLDRLRTARWRAEEREREAKEAEKNTPERRAREKQRREKERREREELKRLSEERERRQAEATEELARFLLARFADDNALNEFRRLWDASDQYLLLRAIDRVLSGVQR